MGGVAKVKGLAMLLLTPTLVLLCIEVVRGSDDVELMAETRSVILGQLLHHRRGRLES